MKNRVKLTALCLGLVAIQTIHTVSLWETAKGKAKSGYQSAKQGWEDLSPEAKNAIIGTGIATAGVAATAGAAYGGYKAYDGDRAIGNRKKSLANPSTRTLSDEEVEQIEQEFLENDPEEWKFQ